MSSGSIGRLGDHAGLAVLEQPVVVRERLDRDLVDTGGRHLVARAAVKPATTHASIVGWPCRAQPPRASPSAGRQARPARPAADRPQPPAAGRGRRRRRGAIAEPPARAPERTPRRHRRGVRLGRHRARHRPAARRAARRRQAGAAAGAAARPRPRLGGVRRAGRRCAPARTGLLEPVGPRLGRRRGRDRRRRARPGPRRLAATATGSAAAAAATTGPWRGCRSAPSRACCCTTTRSLDRCPPSRTTGRVTACGHADGRGPLLTARVVSPRRDRGSGCPRPRPRPPSAVNAHGSVSPVDPEVGLVGVVAAERRGPETPVRLIQRESSRSASDDDHPHRRRRGDLVALGGVPRGRVDDRRCRRRPASGPRLNSRSTGADAGLAEGLVLAGPAGAAGPTSSRPGRAPGAGSARRGRRSIAWRRMSSRVSTTSSVVASSHHGLAGSVSSRVTTAQPALAAVRPERPRAARRGRSASSRLRQTTLKYAAAAAVGGLGEVPVAQQLLAVAVVAAAAASMSSR